MKNLLEKLVSEDILIKGILSNKRKKSNALNKVAFRKIHIANEVFYQFEFFENNKVKHKNIVPENLSLEIMSLTENHFKQLNLFCTGKDIQILAKNIENIKVIEKKNSIKSADFSHNKKKNYILEDGVPCDFLIELGIMSPQGQVFKNHYKKFKQINRYLELVSDSISTLNQKHFEIIDFGCGKAYLTFALYYMLKIQLGYDVNITGLDLKKDVIEFCNTVAQKLGYQNLKFEVGDIKDYKAKSCDIVVSLHACDTATDFALKNAVVWNSKLILAVPCCQHELFNQIDNSILNPILKYGINKDKFNEVLTNGLRALKLESLGYKVDMVEFTSLEHTAKNVVIRGVLQDKLSKNDMLKAKSAYENIKGFFDVLSTTDVIKN